MGKNKYIGSVRVDKTIYTGNLQVLSGKIEDMRYQLNEAVIRRRNNFLDSDIIKLSQKLDLLILEYEKLNKK